MISINDCKDGFLYIIKARNSFLGIYKEENKSFIIRRVKYKLIYLYEENHWETGEPHGTAKPIKELFKVPQHYLHDEGTTLSYLEEQYNIHKNAIKKAMSDVED